MIKRIQNAVQIFTKENNFINLFIQTLLKSSILSNSFKLNKENAFFLIMTLQLCACSTKHNTPSTTKALDSSDAIKERYSLMRDENYTLTISPLDSILVTYKNGKKIYLFILEYYDSLPSKPIKTFEVRSFENGKLIYNSKSLQLYLADEVNHFTGDNDSIVMIPTYYISSKNPLSIGLRFVLNGNLGLEQIEGLTCDVRYHSDDQAKKYLDFLLYKFTYDSEWEVHSYTNYSLCECTVTNEEMLARFNMLKKEKNLTTEKADELLKLSFKCFANGVNSNHGMILKEFRKALGTSLSPYIYYTYITYFDNFINDTNFQIK